MTPLVVRLPHWRSALSKCIEEALQRPFEWGRHDCALFAADAVLAMTGVDPAEGWRGRYSTPRGAIRVLRRDGYDDHIAYAEGYLPEVHPARAAMGDIVMVETPVGVALGVLTGAVIAVPDADGLGFVPRVMAHRAFHVPFAGEAA